jgi:hypothetical protein
VIAKAATLRLPRPVNGRIVESESSPPPLRSTNVAGEFAASEAWDPIVFGQSPRVKVSLRALPRSDHVLRAAQAMPDDQDIQPHHRDDAESNYVFHFVTSLVSLVDTIRTGMAPTVAPATVDIEPKVDVFLCYDWNMTRILGRRICMHGNDAPLVQTFFHS